MKDEESKSNIIELDDSRPETKTTADESVHKKSFTIISNEIIDHQNLSSIAKILLVYLLRQHKDWVFHDCVIQKFLGRGRNVMEAAFKELREAGYVENRPRYNEAGKVRGSYRVFADFPKFKKSNLRRSKMKIIDAPKTGASNFLDAPVSRGPENKTPRKPGPINNTIEVNNTNSLTTTNSSCDLDFLIKEKMTFEESQALIKTHGELYCRAMIKHADDYPGGVKDRERFIRKGFKEKWRLEPQNGRPRGLDMRPHFTPEETKANLKPMKRSDKQPESFKVIVEKFKGKK